jgi:hypothetical protein
MDYDVTGLWSADCQTPDGNVVPVTYAFKVDGGSVTGTLQSPAGGWTIDDGTYANGVMKFKCTMDGNDYPQQFTPTADGKLVGYIDYGEQLVPITLERGKAPPWPG